MNILGVAVARVCVVVRLPWLMCSSSLLSSKFKRLSPATRGCRLRLLETPIELRGPRPQLNVAVVFTFFYFTRNAVD
jgi:hypothetical protein